MDKVDCGTKVMEYAGYQFRFYTFILVEAM
jgi:hypothetical protein